MNGIIKVVVESTRLSSRTIVWFLLMHVLPFVSRLIWIWHLRVGLRQLRELRWHLIGGSSFNPSLLMGSNSSLYFGRIGDWLEWYDWSVVGTMEAGCISPVLDFVVFTIRVDILVRAFGFAMSVNVFDACLIPVTVAEFGLTETVLVNKYEMYINLI